MTCSIRHQDSFSRSIGEMKAGELTHHGIDVDLASEELFCPALEETVAEIGLALLIT